MHQHRKTPLWVSAVAIFVTIFAMLLFGGASYADEAQSAAQSTTAQSVGATTVAVTDEARSSSSSNAAAVADNDAQPANGGHGCVHQDISPGEVDVSLKTSDGSSSFTAYEAVEFAISLTLFEGHCAGDGIVITVPSELGTDGSFDPIPMTTPDGVTIGVATYHPDRTVKIVLSDQVEVPGRKDFYATAWWRVHMSDALVPGEARELVWSVDGITRRTPIQVGTCDGCSQLGAGPSKWGSVDVNAQHVTIVLPTAVQNGQLFTVTDTLTSPGQRFDCDNLMVGRVGIYTKASTWGQPQYTKFQQPEIVSCTDNKATLNVLLDTNEKARFELNVLVDPADPGPWTDTASIVSQDQSWEVSARVVRRESGGNAGFDTNPTPTPTPTPEPAPTPSTSPTPSPSAPNPSATPSPTPSPSTSTPVTPTPAPSASPTPTPSATPTPVPTPSPSPVPTPEPTPSPSATPSASPTPSVTPTPSTTPEPAPTPAPTPSPSTPTSSATPAPVTTPEPARQHKLAVTGAASSATTLAVALLIIGGIGALWARRRQTAHPER